jgi:phage tail sheath protein FI
MRHQFELENTSYAATYGNWVQAYDDFTGEKVWVPFSGYQAAIMARSDAAEFAWSAPAGFTRGLVTNALDIAINPNQKQRDELYKININPVMFSASQGIVVFGQKTMSRKPSAFDRINVRRLFLTLERPTKKAAQFFVFEPNNEFTRTRLVNVLTPIFEFAKQNSGVYDYLIVCDERNNTPQVIDSNEMKVDILLKPTRTAEFILVTFTATRTDANFEELI